MDQLTQLQARRIALAAQGFTDRAHATPSLKTLDRTVARTGVLQVDSVNVLQRAHYMPLYSRMGPYDVDLLRRATTSTPRRERTLVEYWAHVQALMPVELWPLMRHRMEHYRAERGKWGFTADPTLEPRVRDAVRDRGPVTARDLEEDLSTGPRSRENWGWNWSEARKVLDYLYLVGDVAIAGRNNQFEVVYDLPERVLPAAVLDAPTPTAQEAVTELVRRAARSHGVASLACLADYYRLRLQPAPGAASAKVAVEELVEAGELVPVTVRGWKRQAYLHRDARLPRRVSARTLLSPFDPVVWERARAEALFDFFYRIEIYVPPEKRLHGYYVLPFLLGDRLVARVDLKADRATRRLLVPGAFAEAAAPPETADELAAELRRLAGWLGLDDVVVGHRGDLAPALAAASASL
ncbi:winged helix-turn-helix domain-containing protein [Nocardioides ganghwensis]|uniref:Winged helix-turn-helix domain-containing protein n=1 Tax=Nocardioides ganghwensis TaxID=252230 RepID=A0A4Q2SA93_9ACTN|nr:crosslink repair DNA glycosylase YcaQ family protein [Nocardioides ganghwensis]MBD3945780.1 YcaQ family DNA glycosylase [Nocardioides ganghwensis]RYC01175.1 winged helix-turn-helix domain-containing protein [Nocardioides ganghwensis]